MSRIFIIEDDKHLADRLTKVLGVNEYTAAYCLNIEEWEKELEAFHPDVLLLDINLQITNGYVICTTIRQKGHLPIIFITGRDTEEDEIRALNLGGDDYVKKPFSDAILLAHVERQLKSRSFEFRESMEYRELSLKLGKRLAVNSMTDEETELTGMEFQILFYLMGKAEVVVSRGELTDYMWNNRCYVDENALNVNLSRLRGKLAKIHADHMIQSIKGEGLCLCSDNI